MIDFQDQNITSVKINKEQIPFEINGQKGIK